MFNCFHKQFSMEDEEVEILEVYGQNPESASNEGGGMEGSWLCLKHPTTPDSNKSLWEKDTSLTFILVQSHWFRSPYKRIN